MTLPSFVRICLIISFLQVAQTLPVVCQQTSTSQASSSQPPSLASVASQLVQNAQKIGCRPADCKVLVTNFIFPDGKTSGFGMDLPDILSDRLAEQSLTVIDRSLLEAVLQRERLSPKLQNETAVARWLAKDLGANFVIVGEIEKREENKIDLSVHLLNVLDEKASVLNLNGKLDVDTSKLDLGPTNGLASLGPMPDTIDGEKVLSPRAPVALPSCFYMPNPPLTDDARRARFSGNVLIEAIVGVDGKLHALRVVNGVPFGMNEKTVEILETWKCKPSKLNEKPVPVLVPIEVNFH